MIELAEGVLWSIVLLQPSHVRKNASDNNPGRNYQYIWASHIKRQLKGWPTPHLPTSPPILLLIELKIAALDRVAPEAAPRPSQPNKFEPTMAPIRQFPTI